MAKETILDLASSKTWKKRVGRIIDVILPVDVQKLIRQREPEGLYDDTFDYVLESFQETGEYIDFEEINARFVNAFAKVFTHWRGYHSCRPSSLGGYQKNGIVPLTREFFTNEALRLFKGHAPEEKIRKAAADSELKTREGYIYLFATPTSPLNRSCNHYLQSGSEALQGLAVKLGLHCRGILAAQGKPIIIQCKVPSKKVMPAYSECIYRCLVTRYFQHEMSDGKIGIEVEKSCFATGDPILPENIERFIPIEQNKLIVDFHFGSPH